MNKTLLILGALLCVTIVSACENTWHGMGRDIENTGEEMQQQYN